MITKSNAKDWLAIVQAMAEGKQIQDRYKGAVVNLDRWCDIDEIDTDMNPERYRIKPPPRLRAWKPEEAPKMIVMRDKRDVVELSRVYILHPGGFYSGLGHAHDWTLVAACDFCVRLLEDGTEHPCGVLESES